uniref:Uncharacterized protein n=1 Tax=Romanomermis culicivorax TaxID=13658 RepID=A0A915HML8_ROMCU
MTPSDFFIGLPSELGGLGVDILRCGKSEHIPESAESHMAIWGALCWSTPMILGAAERNRSSPKVLA